jgi:hypothetical protein
METNANAMNAIFKSTDENMRNLDMAARLFLSALLLSVIFVDPAIQHKMLYVVPALYLYISAIMKWDPIYAVLRNIRNYRVPLKTSIRMEGRDTVTDATSGNDVLAANDPHRSEDRFKETG